MSRPPCVHCGLPADHVHGDTPAERARNECAAQGIPFEVPMTADFARWLREATARRLADAS